MALARVALLAMVSLAMLVVIFAGLPFPPFHASWLIATVPLSIAGVVGWAVTLRRPGALPWDLVLAPVLVVAAVALAGFASSRPDVALPAVWKVGAGAGTALLFWHAATGQRARRDLLAIASIFLVVFMVVYLGQVIGLWGEWLRMGMPADQLPLRPGATGGIAGLPTWLADQVLVLAPLVVAAWSPNRTAMVATVVLIAAAVATVLISGTRSLWLIALLVIGPVVLLQVRRVGLRPRQLAVGGVVGAVALAVAAWRFNLVERVLRDADAGRSSAFTSAIEAGLSSPTLGMGPATYPLERLETVTGGLRQYAIPNAHNLVLNSFAELGLIGLAAVVAAAAILGRRAWINARAASDRERAITLAAGAGVLVILGHAMVDVVIDVPGIFLMTALVSAFSLVPDPAALRAPEPRGSRIVVAGALAAMVALGATLPALLRQESNVRLVEEAAAAMGSDPGRSLDLSRTAAAASPGFGPALLLEMQAADWSGRPDEAIDAARRAVALDGLPQHRIALARLLAASGDDTGALDAAREVIVRDSLDPFVQLNGAMLLAREEPEEATAALSRWLEVEPLAAMVADQLPQPLVDLLPAAIDRATSRLLESGSTEGAVLLLLASGRHAEEVDAAINRGAGVEHPWLEAIADGWYGSGASVATVEQALLASPTLGRIQTAWLLAVVRCDDRSVDRWAAVYRISGTSDSPAVPVQLGAAPEFVAEMAPELYPSAVWSIGTPKAAYVTGTLSYRRGTPECQR